MPVLIEGLSLVAKRSSVERLYPGGLDAFAAATGPTVTCEWIELRDYAVKGGAVQGARLRGTTSHDLWVPVDWAWATSMTSNMVAAPDEVLERAEFVGVREGVQYYFDPVDDRVRVLGRAIFPAPIRGRPR